MLTLKLTTKKTSADNTEETENTELGFIEKLLELWKLRKRINEAQAEIADKGTLSRYNYRTGEAINKTMDYRSSFMRSLFKERCKSITRDERKRVAQHLCAIDVDDLRWRGGGEFRLKIGLCIFFFFPAGVQQYI